MVLLSHSLPPSLLPPSLPPSPICCPPPSLTHLLCVVVQLSLVLPPPDNALVVQSRVIMLDSILIFLTFASILAYLKFYQHRPHPFSPAWHRALALTGVSLGCLVG